MRPTQSKCSGFMSTERRQVRFRDRLHRSQMLLPKTNRQFRYRQMQIALRRRFEYLAAQKQKTRWHSRLSRKYDNVEFR